MADKNITLPDGEVIIAKDLNLKYNSDSSGDSSEGSDDVSVFGINDRSVKCSTDPLLKGSIPQGSTSSAFVYEKKATSDDTERTMAIIWGESVPDGLDLAESAIYVLGKSGKRYSVSLYSSGSSSIEYDGADLLGIISNDTALALICSYKEADGDPIGADLNGGTVQVFPSAAVEAANG